MNEEKLIEALKEVDKQCKYLNYQCLSVEKNGGDSIQQIVRKVLNG